MHNLWCHARHKQICYNNRNSACKFDLRTVANKLVHWLAELVTEATIYDDRVANGYNEFEALYTMISHNRE